MVAIFRTDNEGHGKSMVAQKWLGWSSPMSAFLMLLPLTVWAQIDGAGQKAATIRTEVLATSLATLTADTLQDRVTPSVALDRTATYLAGELRRLGLKPGFPPRQGVPSDSVWIMRYTLPGQRRLSYTASSIHFAYGDDPWKPTTATVRLDHMARFAPEVSSSPIAETGSTGWGGIGQDALGRPDGNGSSQVTLLAGPHNASSLTNAALDELAEQVVVYIPPVGSDTAAVRQVLQRLQAAVRGVVILRATDSVAFATSVSDAARRTMPIADWYLRWAAGPRRWPWAVDVWPGAVAEVLAAAGVNFSAARAATTPMIQHLAPMKIMLRAVADTGGAATAPIVAGLLPGTDAQVADQYLIVATPMDTPAGVATSAEARGINAAGLLALAWALSDSVARPRRPILFVATSGEAGMSTAWGAHFLAEAPNYFNQDFFGTRNFFLSFDLEQLGHGDSLSIDGAAGLELTTPPMWLAAKHPMPGVSVIDRGSLLPRGSSASAFGYTFVPGLAVKGSVAVTRSRGIPMVSEGTVGALHHVFYLAYEFANLSVLPRWTTAGRRHFGVRQEP